MSEGLPERRLACAIPVLSHLATSTRSNVVGTMNKQKASKSAVFFQSRLVSESACRKLAFSAWRTKPLQETNSLRPARRPNQPSRMLSFSFAPGGGGRGFFPFLACYNCISSSEKQILLVLLLLQEVWYSSTPSSSLTPQSPTTPSF